MCRMSSPGTYSRCWTNSTLNPLNGLLWSPTRRPSTTCRAFSPRASARASTPGCKYSGMVCGSGWTGRAAGRLRGARTAQPRDPLGELEHLVRHRHPADDLLEPEDVLGGEHRVDHHLRVRGAHPHDLLFLLVARVIDLDEEDEPVELGFRQR